jgi:alkylation response protein AidB-like acyl-CoA dehydrogenase
MGGGSPYVSGPPLREGPPEGAKDQLVKLAEANGTIGDPRVRDLIGESMTLTRATTELSRRVVEGMTAGTMSDNIAAVTRLMGGMTGVRRNTIAYEITGPSVAASVEGDPGHGNGVSWLVRQSACIGGGTTEMARNNISERVLGMPRERTHDKDLAYRDVPKGPPAKS